MGWRAAVARGGPAAERHVSMCSDSSSLRHVSGNSRFLVICGRAVLACARGPLKRGRDTTDPNSEYSGLCHLWRGVFGRSGGIAMLLPWIWDLIRALLEAYDYVLLGVEY